MSFNGLSYVRIILVRARLACWCSVSCWERRSPCYSLREIP